VRDQLFLHVMRGNASPDVVGRLPISEFTLAEENICIDFKEFETKNLFPLMRNKLRYTGCDFQINKEMFDKVRWNPTGGWITEKDLIF